MGMKSKQVGKKFETLLKNSTPNNILYLRLRDLPMGYNYGANPADSVLFNGRLLVFCECKTTENKLFALNRISEGQFKRLVEMCVHKNVIGGWLINFRKTSSNYFLPLQTYLTYKYNSTKKSLNERDLDAIAIKVYSHTIRVKAIRMDIARMFSDLEIYYASIFEEDKNESGLNFEKV